MLYKSLLICLLTLIISVPTVLADIQPWSMPTEMAISEASNSPVAKSSIIERISACESGGNNHAKNKYSSASGEFQFIWGTWYKYGLELWGDEFYEKNIWSADNRELATYVINKYGTSDWNASKNCWNNTTT